jgi:cytochrome c oxidase subunit 2
MSNRVFASTIFLRVSFAAAGTALLLGAAMLHQQDLAAASAPIDATAGSDAVRRLAQGQPAETEPRTIEVTAKRFAFEPARIDVREGERIRLVLKSADGVHGIEIKKFKVNKKIPRGGEAVTIEFVANAPGQFPILCSEYCGNDHDAMKGMLVVEAKAPQ